MRIPYSTEMVEGHTTARFTGGRRCVNGWHCRSYSDGDSFYTPDGIAYNWRKSLFVIRARKRPDLDPKLFYVTHIIYDDKYEVARELEILTGGFKRLADAQAAFTVMRTD